MLHRNQVTQDVLIDKSSFTKLASLNHLLNKGFLFFDETRVDLFDFPPKITMCKS